MKTRGAACFWAVVGMSMLPGQAAAQPTAAVRPQRQASLPRMLELAWSAERPLPQGMQDNLVALVGHRLVSVGGFCGGADDDWKPGKYPRGFLNKAWVFDLTDKQQGWTDLPSFPGAPRQALFGTSVGDAVYAWGGFSYAAPFTYRDGYRLSQRNDLWVWEPLPPLPTPAAWSATAAIGTKIYCLGGADYDAKRFYCLTDREGRNERLGARLLVFDTRQPEAGWKHRTPCPGTPRCLAAGAAVDGKLYVIGGISMKASGGYCNVVDNWRYDPIMDTWERLRDLPISGSGTSSGRITYHDRYLLLPCGYQYGEVMQPDGTIVPRYGRPSQIARTWKSHPAFEKTHYYNHHFVYDTRTNQFGLATYLPFDDVATITVVVGETVYMFPGETAGFEWQGEYFGHHPEFVLRGSLRELDWESSTESADQGPAAGQERNR